MTIPVFGQISRDFPSYGSASDRPWTGLFSLSDVSGLFQAEGVTPQEVPL